MCRDFTITALNKKNIIGSLLKFAGYINNHKMFSGNIFGLILKNKMAARDVCLTLKQGLLLALYSKGYYR